MTAAPENDESLMTAFAHGDERAFRVLFQRHAPATLAFLVASTANREAAEDLLQETFARVFRHREDWRGDVRGRARSGSGGDAAGNQDGDSFRAWLFAIARNLARDAGRRFAVRKRAAEDGGEPLLGLTHGTPEISPHQRAEQEDLARRLTEALAKLPEAQREAFVLVRLQELSYEEVASACATTVAAAKMRVARATAALAELLREEGEVPPRSANARTGPEEGS